jgi:hypothetical protein
LRTRQRLVSRIVCFGGIGISALAVSGTLFAQENIGTINGVVIDSSGAGLSGAQIILDSIGPRAITDASGAFFLLGVPVGKLQIHVRRLGFSPESTVVVVAASAVTHVSLRLAPLAVRLPTVEVLKKSEPYDSRLAGFNARRERHAGHFVTRDQLDQMSSARFVDALRSLPGVQLRSLRGGGTTLMLRGSRCPALVFIDGFPADAGTMDLDMIDLSGVEGIEMYSGAASVPSEFMAARETHGCGVIAIWSRPTKPRRRTIGQIGEVDLEKLLASKMIYTSDQVDDPARLNEGSAVAAYPDSLWKAGAGGRVVTEFIVNTDGLIESGSVRIVSATNPYFVSPVKAALGSAAFRPASLAGKTVRQIVELPFVFIPRDSISPPPR